MVKFSLRLAAKILSVTLFVATVCAAYGGYVNPHLWGTPALLTLALPYLAMATAAVTLAWALTRRIVPAALGAVTLVACSGPVLSAFPFGSEKESSGGKVFSLLSFNAMYAMDYNDPYSTEYASVAYVARSGADIVCMQEINGISAAIYPKMKRSLLDSIDRFYPYRLFDMDHGFVILSRYPVRYHDSAGSRSGIADVYVADILGHKVNIVNTHLASYRLSEKEREVVSDIHSVRSAKSSINEFKGSIMSKMKESFRERADEAVRLRETIDRLDGTTIVCGDFNDVPASWAYRKVRGDDLNDAFTETNFGHRATYNAHRMPFHIDQILYRGDIKALKVKREKEGSSDHYPLLAEFEFLPAGK